MHRLPAQCKIAAVVLFVLVVVSTPATTFWAFGAYALVLVALVLLARLPPLLVVRRMVVEVPFLLFALLVPFVAHGPRTEVLGVAVSEPGLTAAGALLVKATLGVAASLTLAATTEPHELLVGLERLRLPAQLVQIMGFMVRYLDVVTDEVRRMRFALSSRGFTARDPRHWPVVARSVGALFIRSYERGERVHLAMLSRGHGTAP